MNDRALLQQALEALEEIHPGNMTPMAEEAWNKAIVSLGERLAHCDRCGKKLGGPDDIHTCSPQVQEPVIDKSAAIRIATALGWEPRREWQGLTVAQIEEAFQQSAGADEDTHIRFARAIEAKLKEKNT